MDLTSKCGFGDAIGDLQFIDWNTPDRQLAKKEPLHPGDGEDFDADLAPEDGDDIDLDGIRAIPRDAIKQLLLFLLPPGGSPKQFWRRGTLRLALLAHLINLDSIGSKSLQELGDQLGVTRSLLSLYEIRIINSLGIAETRNGKSREAREVYRMSAVKSHRERGHRMKQDSPQSV